MPILSAEDIWREPRFRTPKARHVSGNAAPSPGSCSDFDLAELILEFEAQNLEDDQSGASSFNFINATGFAPNDYLRYHKFVHDQPILLQFDAILSDPENMLNVITNPKLRNSFLDWVRDLARSVSIESSYRIHQIILALSLNPMLLRLSACDIYGSATLQELITILKKSPSISMLAEALAIQFGFIAFNPSGRHVIREFIKQTSPCKSEVLCYQVAVHCIELARDFQGCVLLNGCLPFMTSYYEDAILHKICENSVFLAGDRYGTYVVQKAIAIEHPWFTPLIVKRIRGLIPDLSIEKEGSHLVEKCLGCLLTRRIVIEELLRLSKGELRRICLDLCGNYVIQRALSSTMESSEFRLLHWRLRKALLPLEKELMFHRYGSNVYRKLYQIE